MVIVFKLFRNVFFWILIGVKRLEFFVDFNFFFVVYGLFRSVFFEILRVGRGVVLFCFNGFFCFKCRFLGLFDLEGFFLEDCFVVVVDFNVFWVLFKIVLIGIGFGILNSVVFNFIVEVWDVCVIFIVWYFFKFIIFIDLFLVLFCVFNVKLSRLLGVLVGDFMLWLFKLFCDRDFIGMFCFCWLRVMFIILFKLFWFLINCVNF